MIGAIHNEFHVFRNGTEFTDIQFIANKVKVIKYIRLEPLRTCWIVIISVITDNNVLAGNKIFKKANLRKAFHRRFIVGIWT